MSRTSLIIIGVVFLVVTFLVTQVVVSPSDKDNVNTFNSLCTAKVGIAGFDVNIGQFGQKLLGKEEECQKYYYLSLLINYGWIGYAIGGFFLVLGLALGGLRSIYREEIHSYRYYAKHCGECGSRLEGHEKHCPKCGSKI